MIITSHRLTAAAALCAASAGALFIAVQINHPHLDAGSVQTTEVIVRNSAKVVMAVLSLIGFSGLYLSQVRRNGLLGLIGYLIIGSAYLMIMCTTFAAAFVLPQIAAVDPGYANDVIAATTGGSPVGDIGALSMIAQLQNIAFLAGGLLFGVALFRSRVVARWASALLALGGLISAALSLMPDAFYRLLAFPTGIAMIGLGVSLWLRTRTTAATTAAPSAAGPVVSRAR